MTIFSKSQSLSNMLRQLFVFLILGVLVAICFCEPVYRKLLPKASTNIECVRNENDASTCGTAKVVDVSLPEKEEQTRVGRKFAQKLVAYNNDAIGEVSGRKRKGNKGNRMLLYMMGAMKAALIYGMLHGVAALAGKALLIAKIAIAVAIAALLKKHDHEKTAYEIVKHPHHSYIQTHSSSVDYDHRSDYMEDGYDHRKRRRILR